MQREQGQEERNQAEEPNQVEGEESSLQRTEEERSYHPDQGKGGSEVTRWKRTAVAALVPTVTSLVAAVVTATTTAILIPTTSSSTAAVVVVIIAAAVVVVVVVAATATSPSTSTPTSSTPATEATTFVGATYRFCFTGTERWFGQFDAREESRLMRSGGAQTGHFVVYSAVIVSIGHYYLARERKKYY